MCFCTFKIALFSNFRALCKDIMWKNPGEIEGNGIDDDGNGFVDDVFGINTITNSSDPMDVRGFRAGHGTHCAGIIAVKAFQKWQKINFCTSKKFKTTKNAIFGLFSGPKIDFFFCHF